MEHWLNEIKDLLTTGNDLSVIIKWGMPILLILIFVLIVKFIASQKVVKSSLTIIKAIIIEYLYVPIEFSNIQSIFQFCMKTGIFFLFPKDGVKRYFSNLVYFDEPIGIPSNENNIEIKFRKILFVPNEISRVDILVTNNGNEQIYFEQGLSEQSLKKWLKLRVNKKKDVFPKDVDSKYFTKNIILPKETVCIELNFEKLNHKQTANIETLELFMTLKPSRRGIKTDYKLEAVLNDEYHDIFTLLENEIEINILNAFITMGGFTLLAIPFFILSIFINSLILNLFIAILIILTYAIGTNLNSKLIRVTKIILDKQEEYVA